MTQQTSPAVDADRDRLIHILVVHFDMFRHKAEEAADLFLHDKTLRAAPAIEGEPVAWRYRDAWGRWAYCEALDNKAGPTVITEKQPLYLYAHPPGGAVTDTREWQPIQTAPKDGAPVLMGWEENSEWVAVSGWFESGIADRTWYTFMDEEVWPTHWMPLPPPPAALQSTTDGEAGK